MEPRRDRSPTSQSQPVPTPPKRRFEVEKLEERIAPAIHSNPHTKLVGGGGGGGKPVTG